MLKPRFGVNRSGRVVGLATNTVPDANSMLGLGYEARAFVWDQNNGMLDIGTLGGTDAQALLVNDPGEVVGWSYTSSAPSGACASDMLGLSLTTGSFIWDKKNGMVNLGGFGGTCTLASDGNNLGQVVGGSFLTGDQFVHPFLWDRSNGLMELGTLGGDDGTSFAINDRGEAVGGSELKGDVQIDAALWANGAVTDLGQLAGGCGSYAFWINNPGQVVGTAFNDCSDESLTGFLWESGGPMVDLNSLIVPPSSLFVVQAYTINDRGEIAGKGVFPHGVERAVLLIPCDENHPGVEGCDYSLVKGAETARVSAARSPQQKLPAPAKLRGVRGLFLGPIGRTLAPSLHEGGRQAVSTLLGDDFGSVSGEGGRLAQHEAVAEISSCSTSERGASNGEVHPRGYVVHGECSVNDNADTLTGLCQAPSSSRTLAPANRMFPSALPGRRPRNQSGKAVATLPLFELMSSGLANFSSNNLRGSACELRNISGCSADKRVRFPAFGHGN